MEEQFSHTTYWLDQDDHIVRVGGTWDQFALENGGRGLGSASVVGRSIWEFIEGDVTKMWIGTLLSFSRVLGKPVSKPYRCDSPTVKRFMRMDIVPEQPGFLRVEHIVESLVPLRKPIYIRAGIEEQTALRLRCSVCGRIRNNEHWIEPEDWDDAANEHRFVVAYAICEDCLKLLEAVS